MKKVYICAPLGGDIQKHLEKVKTYTRYALQCGTAPVVPHYYALCVDDRIPEERQMSLKAAFSLLWLCDEIWVFGDEITPGMKEELALCEKLHIKAVYVDSVENHRTRGGARNA